MWDEFDDTEDPNYRQCRKCPQRIKISKGSCSGLIGHMLKKHKKQGPKVARDRLKRWIVAAMITVLNVSQSAFNHAIMAILFWLARLGPINSNMARKFVDEEAR